jgi:hypothetical protein
MQGIEIGERQSKAVMYVAVRATIPPVDVRPDVTIASNEAAEIAPSIIA